MPRLKWTRGPEAQFWLDVRCKKGTSTVSFRTCSYAAFKAGKRVILPLRRMTCSLYCPARDGVFRPISVLFSVLLHRRRYFPSCKRANNPTKPYTSPYIILQGFLQGITRVLTRHSTQGITRILTRPFKGPYKALQGFLQGIPHKALQRLQGFLQGIRIGSSIGQVSSCPKAMLIVMAP